jgi:hypothetical protein
MTSPFEKYLGTPLAPELLAIIPPDAPLSLGSTVESKHRGKVPGSYSTAKGTWAGRRDWLEGFATEAMIGEWSKYPDANIGIRTKYFPGIDFDIELASLVRDLLPLAETHLGPAPVRGRDGSPRVMLLYRLADGAEPIRSWSLKFTLLETSTQHAIEILGAGRSSVLEGRHPKGGQYEWRNGISPIDYGPENLTSVTTETLRAFVAALKDKLTALGATILTRNPGAVGSSTNGGERRKIGDPGLVAMNLDTLKKGLELIPCEKIHDRSEWLKLLIAAKAGCSASEDFYEKVALPWCLRYEENTRDYVRKTWDSIKDAHLGADYIFKIARDYDPSFFDDIDELFVASSKVETTEQLTTAEVPVSATPPAGHRGPVPKLMPADFDPRKLPRRPFVLGYRFMAGAVTLGVAPPGTGKSNFSILTALSIATGRPLTEEPVHRIGRVWIHNNEDSLDELYRRISGVLQLHRIEFRDVRENIFVTSGLDERLIVAVKDKDIVRRTEALSIVIAAIKDAGIVHIVIDPLVSTHRGVSENSNEEIEQVAETISHIAHETGCSIDLVHHSIKSHSGNTESHAGDMNASRGASSLTGSVRIMYTLAPMNRNTAKELKIPPQLSTRLVRLDQGKGNYSARDSLIRWFELISVSIGNGSDAGVGFMVDADTVAVPVPWKPLAIEEEVTEDDAKNVDPKDAERQRVRDFLAQTMQTDRVELSSLIKVIEKQYSIGKTAARNRVMKALKVESGGLAQANGVAYRLTIVREEPSPPNPVFVVRTVVDSEEDNGTLAGVASVVVGKAA